MNDQHTSFATIQGLHVVNMKSRSRLRISPYRAVG